MPAFRVRQLSSSMRSYRGLIPYQTEISTIESNPLVELQKASVRRGVADDQGRRLPGAPWAFSLAETTGTVGGLVLPTVRTIGFQRISEDGLDWLTPREGSLARKSSQSVAICYTEGFYPPPPGETCEQWRAEGRPREIPVSVVLDTAPIGSFAQIVAVGRRKQGSSAGRAAMEDREQFVDEVNAVRQELEAGKVELAELESCVRAVRLVPDRIELMVSGQIWERFQWTREEETWSVRTRLMPY